MTPLGRYSRLTPTARPLRVLGSSYQNTSLRVRYSRAAFCAHAPTSRIPIERSRGGRSPRAEQAGQLRRPSSPARLVQHDVDCVQPSLHSDLADEHEHVERAGLGHVHNEGEVLDVQASAPARSSLGDHARHPRIPPHCCISKQMASKLSTASSSNTAVGESTARTTIKHACSHRRHERRERRDQRHGRSARLGGSII